MNFSFLVSSVLARFATRVPSCVLDRTKLPNSITIYRHCYQRTHSDLILSQTTVALWYHCSWMASLRTIFPSSMMATEVLDFTPPSSVQRSGEVSDSKLESFAYQQRNLTPQLSIGARRGTYPSVLITAEDGDGVDQMVSRCSP